MIHTKKTQEGDRLRNYETELAVQCDNLGSEMLILWPMTITHKIKEDSPFYNMSARDMLNEKFEVVVLLDGTIESTGQSTHARTSFLSSEILWGYRFENMVEYNEKLQCYEADYGLFDMIVREVTPLCSSAELRTQSGKWLVAESS